MNRERLRRLPSPLQTTQIVLGQERGRHPPLIDCCFWGVAQSEEPERNAKEDSKQCSRTKTKGGRNRRRRLRTRSSHHPCARVERWGGLQYFIGSTWREKRSRQTHLNICKRAHCIPVRGFQSDHGWQLLLERKNRSKKRRLKRKLQPPRCDPLPLSL